MTGALEDAVALAAKRVVDSYKRVGFARAVTVAAEFNLKYRGMTAGDLIDRLNRLVSRNQENDAPFKDYTSEEPAQ